MNDRTAVLLTAWATVIIAGIAIMSFREQSARNKEDARIRAEAFHQQDQRYKVERNHLEAQLRQWQTENRQTNEQFLQQMTEWEQRRRDEELREERRERQLSEERLARNAPLLSIARCCNQVPIGWQEYPDRDSKVRMVIVPLEESSFEEDASVDDREESKMLLRKVRQWKNHNIGHVARVVNLGGGPALETHVIWHVDDAVDRNGVPVRLAPLNAKMRENRDALWPAMIRPDEEATIEQLPLLVSEDIELNMQRVDGRVALVCKDLSGKRHVFTQHFQLFLGYDPWIAEGQGHAIDLPAFAIASFHFNDLGRVDGPFPHQTRPLLPKTQSVLKTARPKAKFDGLKSVAH